jgi:hypothetical protein
LLLGQQEAERPDGNEVVRQKVVESADVSLQFGVSPSAGRFRW